MPLSDLQGYIVKGASRYPCWRYSPGGPVGCLALVGGSSAGRLMSFSRLLYRNGPMANSLMWILVSVADGNTDRLDTQIV